MKVFINTWYSPGMCALAGWAKKAQGINLDTTDTQNQEI